jgi:diadenosine tetraphosphate (Ap4A) HIT family hydrolase
MPPSHTLVLSNCVAAVGVRVYSEIMGALDGWDEKKRWNTILGAGVRDVAPPTLFDKILAKQIPATIVYEDEHVRYRRGGAGGYGRAGSIPRGGGSDTIGGGKVLSGVRGAMPPRRAIPPEGEAMPPGGDSCTAGRGGKRQLSPRSLLAPVLAFRNIAPVSRSHVLRRPIPLPHGAPPSLRKNPHRREAAAEPPVPACAGPRLS